MVVILSVLLKSGENFNLTGSNFGSPNSQHSLKGKLQALETQLRGITEDINKHKKEVETLRTEKGTLEKVLSMNTENVRKTLTTEINRVEEEMKRNFAQQKAENNRLQQQIITLKTEKTHLQQELLALQRRIAELELQVGSEEKN